MLDQLGRVFAILGVPDENSWERIERLPDYGKVKFVSKPNDGDGLLGAVPRIAECAFFQEKFDRTYIRDIGSSKLLCMLSSQVKRNES